MALIDSSELKIHIAHSHTSHLWLIMVPTGTGNQGKPRKMGRHFPVREFCQDWKSQGILPKILEKQENLNKKNVFCESQGILHKMLENQWI